MAASEPVDTPRPNPYIGPAPFRQGDRHLFFGRRSEVESLVAAVVAWREVLFYAPSGAGKTSLLNAGLTPALTEKGYEVLPIARVSAIADGGSGNVSGGGNPFTLSVLSYLGGGAEAPEGATLASHLAPAGVAETAPRESDQPRPRVLILDQFEEILNPGPSPEYREARRDFFAQLGEAIQGDPLLRVLFVLREDRIAGLDPYAHFLPNRLRARRRMEHLSREQALAAIRSPAELGRCPFAPGVAEELLDNLRQERIPGQEELVLGEHVEPLQLQVVCYRLWEGLGGDGAPENRPSAITLADLQRSGDVDQALDAYYTEAIERVARQSGVAEPEVRRWIEGKLITASGIRDQVSWEAAVRGTPFEAVVSHLEGAHLLRREEVRGGIWYEIVHDRFVQPILESNRRHTPDSIRRLAEDTLEWERRGGGGLAPRARSFLYRGTRLAEARAEAEAHGDWLGARERRFLEAGETWAARRREWRMRWFSLGALVILVLFSSMILRERSLKSAFWASSRLHRDPVEARALALRARGFGLFTPGIVREVLGDSWAAPYLARVSLLRDDRSTPVSLVIPEDQGPLLATVSRENKLTVWDLGEQRSLPLPRELSAGCNQAALSPDGRFLAATDLEGALRVWPLAGGSFLELGATGSTDSVAFSPDSALIAGWGEAIRIWRLPDGLLLHSLPVSGGRWVLSLAFSPDGEKLATGDVAGQITILHLGDEALSQTITGAHGGAIVYLAFNHDGSRLASAADDGLAKVWEKGNKIAKVDYNVFCILPSQTADESSEETSFLAISFLEGGSQLIALNSNGNALVAESENKACHGFFSVSLIGPPVPTEEARGYGDEGGSGVFSPDGTWGAASGPKGVITFRVKSIGAAQANISPRRLARDIETQLKHATDAPVEIYPEGPKEE